MNRFSLSYFIFAIIGLCGGILPHLMGKFFPPLVLFKGITGVFLLGITLGSMGIFFQKWLAKNENLRLIVYFLLFSIANYLSLAYGHSVDFLPWVYLIAFLGMTATSSRPNEITVVLISLWSAMFLGFFREFLPSSEYITLQIDAFMFFPAVLVSILAVIPIFTWTPSDIFVPLEEKPESEKESDSEKMGVSETINTLTETVEEKKLAPSEATKSILDPVVFFMNRNFKAFSSLGFVADSTGNTFSLNSFYSRSGKINPHTYIIKGQGILGKVIKDVRGFYSGNLRQYENPIHYYEEHTEINSIMAIPIYRKGEGRVEGMLIVDSDRQRAFTDQHKELLIRFAQIAYSLLANARLTEQVQKHAVWADSLYNITKKLNQTLKNREIYQVLTQTIQELFAYDRFFICTYQGEQGKGIIWEVSSEKGQSKRGQFNVFNEKSLYGQVFQTGKENFAKNLRSDLTWDRFETPESLDDRPEEILLSPLTDMSGSVLAVIGLESKEAGAYSEIDLQKLNTLMTNFSTALDKSRMLEDLEKLATLDGLTEIPNHRKLQEILDKEVGRAKRYNSKFAFFLMDIDHFKKFNDTWGHPLGDKVLKVVASTIQKTLRNSDYCARYGGEEFAVVMIDANLESAIQLGERIRQNIEKQSIPHEGKTLSVTVSLGCSLFPANCQEKVKLISYADKALYVSKERGRNRLTMASDILEKIKAEEA